MAVFPVTNKFRLDGYAVLQLLLEADMLVGRTITVAGVDATFNGVQTIIALPEYEFIGVSDEGELLYNGANPIPNQVLYASAGDDVDLVAASGTVTYTPVCTWIDGTDVQAWLGLGTVSVDEAAFLTQCADASNQFCWRRRQESNYFTDSLTTVPSADVQMGTIMYAGALYRQRGSIDQFASFNEMGTAPVVGLSPIIKQLLGLGAHAVA